MRLQIATLAAAAVLAAVPAQAERGDLAGFNGVAVMVKAPSAPAAMGCAIPAEAIVAALDEIRSHGFAAEAADKLIAEKSFREFLDRTPAVVMVVELASAGADGVCATSVAVEARVNASYSIRPTGTEQAGFITVWSRGGVTLASARNHPARLVEEHRAYARELVLEILKDTRARGAQAAKRTQ